MLQLLGWPQLVQMMRVKQRRPRQNQRAEGLTNGALEGALLREYGQPRSSHVNESFKEGHRASGLREKVFFSGRRNRSPRGDLLGEGRNEAFAIDGDAE